jgi:hypothetical protein
MPRVAKKEKEHIGKMLPQGGKKKQTRPNPVLTIPMHPWSHGQGQCSQQQKKKKKKKTKKTVFF